MSELKTRKKIAFIIHPILFSIFPVIFIFSENIHLLPITEIFLPLVIVVGITVLVLFLTKNKIEYRNKVALIISLIIILFFTYGYFYDIINAAQLENSEISRHRYLLMPYFGLGIVGVIFFIKSNRLFNNATTITNGIAISIIVVISMNVAIDVSNGNFFGSPELGNNEKFLGVGAQDPLEELVVDRDSNQDLRTESKKIQNIKPDIYYIIPDEYPSNYALKQFFGFDNIEFLTFLETNDFHVVNNSFSNYPSTIQSLTSSLNMEYLDTITEGVDVDSKNYHLLNELLSDNLVMRKLSSQGYDVVNVGSLWGPNGEFKNIKSNLCEFKEVNRDSLSRQLIEKTIISYFYERYFEQLRRDQIICTYNEIELLSEEQNKPKFIFVHILSPHSPYIFGPNGEHTVPGDSINSSPWNERNAHVNQVKFVNKNLIELIPKLLDSENKPIIILQGDTGSGYEIDWKSPSDVTVIERMSNLNAVYFPNNDYSKIHDLTPVNTFRIIFNEYFDEENVLYENRSYWSNSDKPYQYKDVSDILKDVGNSVEIIEKIYKELS